MKKKIILIVFFITILNSISLADEIDPKKIIDDVISNYRLMDTYQAEGIVITQMKMGNVKEPEISELIFSIKLKKPDLYLITWSNKSKLSGSIWNAGNGTYLYMGSMNEYYKEANNATAFASATGASSRAASNITSLFFTEFNQPPFISRITDLKYEGIEEINGEPCYVISGKTIASSEEKLWISKDKYLIIKYATASDSDILNNAYSNMETSEIQGEVPTDNMGIEMTEKQNEEMKAMVKTFAKMALINKFSSQSTENHKNISSPELNNKDFEFILPEGTVLTTSLMERMFGTTQVK